MKITFKILIIVGIICLLSYSNFAAADPALGDVKFSSHFDCWYTNNFSSKPSHAVTNSAVEDFLPILEDIRSKELSDIGFDNPLMRMVKIFDQGGINARGGYWGMKFDPFFLDEPDSNEARSATLNEKYAVAAHEYFHVIQSHYFYKSFDARDWILEGNARLLQDKLDFPGTDIDIDGTALFNFFGESNGFLGEPNRNIFKASYAACLFWNYVSEQYGSIRTEPEMGVDVLLNLWEAAQHRNGHWRSERDCFNRMMDRLGYPDLELDDVLANFFAANYLNNKTTVNDPRYDYIDDKQGPGTFKPVKIRRDRTMYVSETVVDTDSVIAAGSQYYKFFFRSDTGAPTDEYPISIQVNQISRNDMVYQVILIDGATGDISVEQYFAKDLDVTKSVTPGTELMLIVSSLRATDSNVASFHYAINAHNSPVINLLSPLGDMDSHLARAGNCTDPEKIMVTLNVFGNGLDIIRGIDPEDFHVEIGGLPATVTVVHEEYGIYFLEVLPPPQAADGKYDLTIEYSIASITEPGAVLYADLRADMVTVIDASGSMDSDNKLDAAKVASQVYLSSARDSDLFGIVYFDQDAHYFSEGLFDVNTYRNDLYNNISNIVVGGSTSVGDGIFTANNWIYEYGDSSHEKYMVVLSDGLENAPRSIWEVEQLLWDGNNNTRLFAVVLGDDANAGALDPVSLKSGGLILYGLDNTTVAAPQPSSNSLLLHDIQSKISASSDYPITSMLTNFYRILAGESSREQRIYANSQILDGTWTIHEEIKIAQAKTASIVMSFRSENRLEPASVSLVDPDGISYSVTHSQIQIGDNGDQYGHFIWKILYPKDGEYKITFSGSDEIEYFCDAAVHSPVTMETYFPLPGYVPIEERNYRVTGCEFPIIATMSGFGPITGEQAQITAKVSTGSTDLDYQSWNIKLYDDGRHGDGYPRDGVFGNKFTRTQLPGTYQVEINAVGVYDGEAFTRQQLKAFNLVPDEDKDNDGLPKYWEIRHDLDDFDPTGDNGPEGDPDGDEVYTKEELAHGTYPRLVDTDEGGETDFSEIFNNRDPWYSEDDGLFPPEIYALPADQMARVFYSNETVYSTLDLYRTDDLTIPFTLVASGLDPDVSHYNDTGLINGHTYYYRMQAHGATDSLELSGFSEITEVVPSLDQPEGYVMINKGDKYTNDADVTMLLYTDNATEVRLSHDSSFEGVSWQPFATKIPFTLTGGPGLQTVYVQFRDIFGTVGGHDSGDYGFASIILDYSYVPSSASSGTTSTDTGPEFTPIDFYSTLGAIPFILYFKKRKKHQSIDKT